MLVQWVANPFRGDKFEAAWLPVAEAALDYGATGWAFFRAHEGCSTSSQFAFFETKLDWERYWYSEEISEARAEASGLYQVPLLPATYAHRRHGLAGARAGRRRVAELRPIDRDARPTLAASLGPRDGFGDSMGAAAGRAAGGRRGAGRRAVRVGRPEQPALGACPAKDALGRRDRQRHVLPYTFCDDGVPGAAGGATPTLAADERGRGAERLHGIRGLPGHRRAASRCPARTRSTTVALDVDVSLPDPAHVPAAGDRVPARGDDARLLLGQQDELGGTHASTPAAPRTGTTTTPGSPPAATWSLNYTARGFVERRATRARPARPSSTRTATRSTTTSTWPGQLADPGDLDPGAPATGRSTPSGSCPPAAPTAAASPGWR